jgi:hypothetical protein
MTFERGFVSVLDDRAQGLMGAATYGLHVVLRGGRLSEGDQRAVSNDRFEIRGRSGCRRKRWRVHTISDVILLDMPCRRTGSLSRRSIATVGSEELPCPRDGPPEMHALSSASSENKFELFAHAGVVERRVLQMPFDALMDGQGRIGFIKIDVEGFEYAVLEGALSSLRRDRPFLLIEICRVHNPGYAKTLELLRSAGYLMYAISKDGLRPGDPAQIADQPDTLDNLGSGNAPAPQWDFLFAPSERAHDLRQLLISN